MSGAVGDRKRLIRITEGNLRNSHLYVSEHLDFFPDDIVGPSKLEGELNGRAVSIDLAGLNETIYTDIGADSKSGKPRRVFRRRSWVRRFFDHHNIKDGDLLALERIEKRRYRLYPFQAKSNRNDDWRGWVDDRDEYDQPTAIELFAGCGGMARA